MEDQVSALHTAARRFCMDRHASWATRYLELDRSGKARIGSGGSWVYSGAAYGLFPRYRLDEAILNEVEKITGKTFPSLASARRELAEAGNQATKVLLDEFAKTREAVSSIQEEAESFRQFVEKVNEDELRLVVPLPYRRVLSREESDKLWSQLNSDWDVTAAGHYWYPLADIRPGINAIAFHEELWAARRGRDLLRHALLNKNIYRCFVLRELGSPEYELDSESADTAYDGSESFTTSDFTWLVYASHESSVTVAGWLADLCRSEWPDWNDLTYGGPFHTDDLRGTWNA